ncbi:MAG TPA: efflux RND transporter periplasmic adaptor subunit [Syntrophomonadaceae bacterium]|nr:efflux RND transporter periplasmic adaptor subunit [Syntrophomonadaceae bacterium]
METLQEIVQETEDEITLENKTGRKKLMMIIVLMAGIVTILGVTGYYWYMSAHYTKTDDARVDVSMVSVSPQMAGRIAEIYVSEGDTISQGALIARQVDLTLTSGTNLDMAVIKSPVSGTVIKKLGNVGETGMAGQPIVYVADLSSVFISANIEETELAKVKPGQLVDFTIDAFPGFKFSGQVSSIVNATTSSFSLLGSSNTGGNYTKVVQRIPIKITINNLQGCKLMPGMNAFVKIHIK